MLPHPAYPERVADPPEERVQQRRALRALCALARPAHPERVADPPEDGVQRRQAPLGLRDTNVLLSGACRRLVEMLLRQRCKLTFEKHAGRSSTHRNLVKARLHLNYIGPLFLLAAKHSLTQQRRPVKEMSNQTL